MILNGRLYIFAFLLYFLTGCVPLDLETKYRFEELRKQVDSNLTNHFDLVENRFNNASFKYPNSYKNNGLSIMILIPNIKGNFETVMSLRESALGSISMDSNCKLIVENPSSNAEYSDSECDEVVYPIPDYSDWWTGLSEMPNDLTFFILNYEGGKFLPDSLLTNGGGMPKNLKNGFSKGFALSEKKKKMIFWLIVW